MGGIIRNSLPRDADDAFRGLDPKLDATFDLKGRPDAFQSPTVRSRQVTDVGFQLGELARDSVVQIGDQTLQGDHRITVDCRQGAARRFQEAHR